MLKITLVFIFTVLAGLGAEAQAPSADSVYNQYLDFNLARFQGQQDKVLEIGGYLLPYADQLPEKARINFYFYAGKMYEDNGQLKKALPLYEKVAAAVPDYYVVHRALGYLYLGDATDIAEKLNSATKDAALNQRLAAEYTSAVRKALPHLEKAQACDPSDETLGIIKTLYKNIKDDKGLNSLDARLRELNAHCIDILPDK